MSSPPPPSIIRPWPNNLLGSAAINVLLLAVADSFIGRKGVTTINARPSTMMLANLCMLVLIATTTLIMIDDLALFGVGVGSVAICALSITSFWLSTGHDARSSWTVSDDGDGEPDDEARDEEPRVSQARLVILILIDGALLFSAGYALSQTGDGIATQTGIASAFVGFALIGTATSLPELVTIMTALRIGRPEMAFGQVLGTNFVNLSLLPLADLMFDGEPVLNTLGDFEIVAALLGATLIGTFMVGLLERRDRTIFKMGIDSAVVILLFGMGTALLSTF